MEYYFFVVFFLGAFAAIGCIVWSVKGHLKNKKANIAAGIVLGFLLINVVALWMIKKDEQKEIEETIISEVEQRIEEFKQENPDDDIKYEITSVEIYGLQAYVRVVYNIETAQEPEMLGDYKYYPSHPLYSSLLRSVSLDVSDIISAELYGEVYVNGELKETEDKKIYGSSNSGSEKCSVCGKSYSSGGTSNMCSQCYKNYKYAADAAGY